MTLARTLAQTLALVLSCLLLGCAGDPYADAHSRGMPSPTIGLLPNPFSHDPNLAAVSVVLAPPNPYDSMSFASATRPPSMIFYAFWDGRVHQVQYSNYGGIVASFWWPRGTLQRQGSVGWSGFDFTYGSDPTFLRHRDPRLRDAPPPPVAVAASR